MELRPNPLQHLSQVHPGMRRFEMDYSRHLQTSNQMMEELCFNQRSPGTICYLLLSKLQNKNFFAKFQTEPLYISHFSQKWFCKQTSEQRQNMYWGKYKSILKFIQKTQYTAPYKHFLALHLNDKWFSICAFWLVSFLLREGRQPHWLGNGAEQ